MTSIYDTSALERKARERGLDPQWVHRLQASIFRKQQSREEALAALNPSVADFMAGQCRWQWLTLRERMDSTLDGSTKLVFVTAAGDAIESVILRIATGRTTVCVSSQSGCAAACEFCATGKMGKARNLSTEEILDQVVQAGRLAGLEGRRVRNLVFMGMGEPFHNEANVFAALDHLTAPRGFSIDAKRILVSTVGIPGAMVRFARRFPRMGLAVSLHSATQAEREQLIPVARRHDLTVLRSAIEEANRIQEREVMIEYLLLREVNDRMEDANALAEYLEGLRVHINLIPFNPIAGAPHLLRSDAATQAQFAAQLKERNFKVTTRYSLGTDIAAACGQLAKGR